MWVGMPLAARAIQENMQADSSYAQRKGQGRRRREQECKEGASELSHSDLRGQGGATSCERGVRNAAQSASTTPVFEGATKI